MGVGLSSLQAQFKPEDRPLWIHSVSVGEVLAAIPLIYELKKKYPVCLSTTTATGYHIAQSKLSRDVPVFYYPFDIIFIVKRFIKRLHPRMIILMESELWPNLILQAHKNNIPLIVLNGRISISSQKIYRILKFLYRPLFKRITLWGVQTDELKEFFISLGVEGKKVQVTGNIKFDISIPEGLASRRELNNPILTAASTHDGEEEVILNIYKRLKEKIKNLKLVIIPRHHERINTVEKYVFNILREKPSIRVEESPPVVNWLSQDKNIFLVGTFGELLEFYSLSTIVFVGKSLFSPGGGQNIIEPCALGRAVLCGPYMGNFCEVTEYFLKEKALIQTSKDELEMRIMHLLENHKMRESLELRAQSAVEKRKGILLTNLKLVESILRSLR